MTIDDDAERVRVVQRRERRHMWLAASLVALTLVLAVLMVAYRSPGLGAWEWALVIGFMVVPLLLIGGATTAFVLWRRRRGSALFARSPLWELPTNRQRQALVRHLRRGGQVPAEVHDLALRVARDTVARRHLTWVFVALAVVQFLNALLQDGVMRWLFVAAVVGCVGVAIWHEWFVGRMRRAVERLEADVVTGS